MSPSSRCGGRSDVQADDYQSVEVQNNHQNVLDSEEHQHLVKNVEVDNYNQADNKERSILDEKALHNVPYVRTMSRQPFTAASLHILLFLRGFTRPGGHH